MCRAYEPPDVDQKPTTLIVHGQLAATALLAGYYLTCRESTGGGGHGAIAITAIVFFAAMLCLVSLRYIIHSIIWPLHSLAGDLRSLAPDKLAAIGQAGFRPDEIGQVELALSAVRMHLLELTRKMSALEGELRQEQRAAAAQCTAMSATFHDFLTPLTIIDAQAQRLIKARATMQPEDVGERAGKIRSAVLRITSLVDSLLKSRHGP